MPPRIPPPRALSRRACRQYATPSRSPTIKRKERSAPPSSMRLPYYTRELPPLAELDTMSKAGMVESHPRSLLGVLQALDGYGMKLSASKTIAICKEHDVDVADLDAVAYVSLRQRRPIAKPLLLLASAAGVPHSTLRLLRAALKQQGGQAFRSAELAPARAHFGQLLAEKNTTAMMLQAEVYQAEANIPGAIFMLRGALHFEVEAAKKVVDEDPAVAAEVISEEPSVSVEDELTTASIRAWTTLGQLYLAINDTKMALKAFKTSAYGANDPEGHYWLATLLPLHSAQWVTSMTKAAASGHVEAAYELGKMYATPVDAIADAETRADQHQLAANPPVEWRYHLVPPTQRPLSMAEVSLIASAKPGPGSLTKRLDARTAMAVEWFDLIWKYHDGAAQALIDLVVLGPDAPPPSGLLGRVKNLLC
ncbi:uncharacterized protein K452DRAFT_296348 [Aplosporella prunicola CBS 121167]|uniref:Uncharacterized protein n=1 Tax=Aplosporella prunicola CBS 121167 TaxID=1176127 RepID=A0A6A6BJB2_9PEZI|nr:uncharacterized protein K452DRAFT_296348 [Aplosporella prunicola CBS 121167]KAF2144106.1 hypothetical protein K452DRAFT_296348 [Aplosporella prunicola CBS 121167]